MPTPMLPWGFTVIEPPATMPMKDPSLYGPYAPTPSSLQDEWSNVWEYPAAIASKIANQSRLLFSSNASPVKQGEPSQTGPAWYDIPGRISAASSAVSEGVQSTLVKVIILVAIVGMLALFGLSYVQAKGASLAK